MNDANKLESPVQSIPSDPKHDSPEEGIALCLSGGGYRAMLFHTGVLWRLNEFGYLQKLDRISSVSGGSITAAVLGLKWSQLNFNNGKAANYESLVVSTIRKLAGKTIDRKAILRGIFLPGSIANKVVKAYRKHLFGSETLQALPDKPRFVINSTNIQSGVLWRFSKPYMRDWRVGKIESPEIELAVAVAASSAFPPVLSPLVLKFDESDYVPGTGYDLQRPPYTTKVVLSDGGVYDNFGLETAWKRYKTILVSDAGGKLKPNPIPKRNRILHLLRVLNVIDNQVRSLRKRQLISSYLADTCDGAHREGAYWGIRSKYKNYTDPDALDCPHEKTLKLANISTRFKRLNDDTQEKLINWGYAICDAAMRKHVDSTLPTPPGFPYPGTGV